MSPIGYRSSSGSARSAGERPARVGGEDLDLGQLQLAAHEVGAEVDRDALVERDAAREPLAAEATVGGEHEALRRHVLQRPARSEEHTSELQSPCNLVCRLLLEKKKNKKQLLH